MPKIQKWKKKAKRLKWQTKKCQKSEMPNVIVQKSQKFQKCQNAKKNMPKGQNDNKKKMAKGKKAKHVDAINNAKVTSKIFHEYYAAF